MSASSTVLSPNPCKKRSQSSCDVLCRDEDEDDDDTIAKEEEAKEPDEESDSEAHDGVSLLLRRRTKTSPSMATYDDNMFRPQYRDLV